MPTPTNIRRPSADTRKLLYDTRMVTIEVGIEQERFVVHQSFLCAKSVYFEKALLGSFKEAATRLVQLPDISTVLFRIFVAWLYHGDLGYDPRSGKTIDEDFTSLRITDEDLQPEDAEQSKPLSGSKHDTESISPNDGRSGENVARTIPSILMANTSELHASTTAAMTDEAPHANETQYRGDDTTNWPCEILVKLYFLADRLDVRELRADSIDALVHANFDTSWKICMSRCIRYIYLNTSSGSILRKYVVHRAAYGLAFSEDASEWLTCPTEFLVAVMITNGRRLPNKLCQECYESAFRTTPVPAPQIDDRDPEQDSPPYITDLCFYHEHPNEEEREACRLRRQGPKPAV